MLLRADDEFQTPPVKASPVKAPRVATSRPDVFNSLMMDDGKKTTKTLKDVDYLPGSRSHVVSPTNKFYATAVVKVRSSKLADDFEVQVRTLQERLLTSSMYPCGNLTSNKRKEVKIRIKCISALL